MDLTGFSLKAGQGDQTPPGGGGDEEDNLLPGEDVIVRMAKLTLQDSC